MPSIRQMFPRRYLSMHDFNPNEQRTVTIKSVELERAVLRPGRFGQAAQASEPKWLIFFHEYPKPMELRPGRGAKFGAALGSENTDDWIGKRVVIYRGFIDVAGEMQEGLLIDTRPAPQLPAGAPPASLMITTDKRPIPKAAMDRFLNHLKSAGSSWDGFLRWCRLQCPEAIAVAWGVELDQIPAGVLPVMKRFLDSLMQPAALPQGEVVNRATGEVITPAPAKPAPATVQEALAASTTADCVDDRDIPF